MSGEMIAQGSGPVPPDIFISHARDEELATWLPSFLTQLQAGLAKALGRRVSLSRPQDRITWDDRGWDTSTEAMTHFLSTRARIFLHIAGGRQGDGREQRWELQNFLSEHGEGTGRLAIIEWAPLGPSQLSPFKPRAHQCFQFWRDDKGGGTRNVDVQDGDFPERLASLIGQITPWLAAPDEGEEVADTVRPLSEEMMMESPPFGEAMAEAVETPPPFLSEDQQARADDFAERGKTRAPRQRGAAQGMPQPETAAQERKTEVFICSAHDDSLAPWARQFAESLELALASRGLGQVLIYHDVWGVHDNDREKALIDRAIDEAELLLVIASPGLMHSEWATAQIARFLDKNGGPYSRFLVEALPPPEDTRYPDLYDEHLPYVFWERDDSDAPWTRPLPLDSAIARHQMDKLADAMVRPIQLARMTPEERLFEGFDFTSFRPEIRTGVTDEGPEGDQPSLPPPPPVPPTPPTTEPNTDFVFDTAEVEKDELNRSPLAIGLARRLHRIWRRANEPGVMGEDASFVVHLDAPWGGGKTTFANHLARVLNPRPKGVEPASFLRQRYGDEAELGGIFLDDPPRDEADRAARIAAIDEDHRRPWLIVNFNAWQHEHCAPPWWVFYQAIRQQCFKAVRDEGADAWGSVPVCSDEQVECRWWHYAGLVVREYWWRLSAPKVATLLLTALISGALLGLLLYFGAWGEVGKPGEPKAGLVLTNGLGVLLAGMTGASFLWGLSAIVTESIVPGTDTLAERLSLGKSDPFERFRRHFNSTMRAVKRPVLVVVDDLDRCQPAFIVDLVRGIQTVLRSSRVMFLILGDRDWIERAFEAHHSSMAKVDVGPEQSFGARFVEKAIQMSFILPALGQAAQSGYVRRVLLSGRDAPEVQPLDQETAALVQKIVRRETAQDAAVPLEAAPIIKRVMEQIAPEAAAAEPERLAQIEQAVSETLAINAAVDERVAQAVKHELEALADAFPANPRQIKRIVNAITIYWAVALQKPGLTADAALRYQLAIWITLMTEWPQTWRTLMACPALADCANADDMEAALEGVDEVLLPGSKAAALAELKRIRADPQLVTLLAGGRAEGRLPLTAAAIRDLADLTPLRTRKWKLPEPEGAAKPA